MGGHTVSPFDLSQILLVGGGLLVPCSLLGPPVITHTNGYYGSWPGRVVSVSMFPVTFYSKTSLMEI